MEPLTKAGLKGSCKPRFIGTRASSKDSAGGTLLSSHPAGTYTGCCSKKDCTSLRLSQLVNIDECLSTLLLNGSTTRPLCRQKPSRPPRSYVRPASGNITGSRNITCVIGHSNS